jgi:hypothetical protein
MCPGMIGDFSLALDFWDDLEKASEEKKKWTTMVSSSFLLAFYSSAHMKVGNFPLQQCRLRASSNICHNLESFIFLTFMLRVNITGPYHQLQDWPVPIYNTNAIETGISTTVDLANLTTKKFRYHWGQ